MLNYNRSPETSVIPLMRATYPFHIPILHFVVQIIYSADVQLCIFSMRSSFET
jgi:hypothetical protein